MLLCCSSWCVARIFNENRCRFWSFIENIFIEKIVCDHFAEHEKRAHRWVNTPESIQRILTCLIRFQSGNRIKIDWFQRCDKSAWISDLKQSSTVDPGLDGNKISSTLECFFFVSNYEKLCFSYVKIHA